MLLTSTRTDYDTGPIRIERWATVAVVSQGSSMQIELWDAEGRTVPFSDSTGLEYGSVSLQVGQTPQSLPFIAAQTGFNVATKGIPDASVIGGGNELREGIGGCILNTGVNPIAYNSSGTSNGSGSNGIAGSGARGPSINGPRFLQPGDLLYFGMYIEPVVIK